MIQLGEPKKEGECHLQTFVGIPGVGRGKLGGWGGGLRDLSTLGQPCIDDSSRVRPAKADLKGSLSRENRDGGNQGPGEIFVAGSVGKGFATKPDLKPKTKTKKKKQRDTH